MTILNQEEITLTVTAAFSKYIKDFKLELNQTNGTFSFSYHCTIDGKDVMISDGVDVDDKNEIVKWVWTSLVEIANRENTGQRLDSVVKDLERKGKELGFDTGGHYF